MSSAFLCYCSNDFGYNHLTHSWQNLSHITGIFNNTGIFGGLVAMGFVTILGLMRFKNRISRIVLSILLAPITIQLIYSQSRAAWIAAIVGVAVLAFPFFRRLTKSNKVLLLSVLLVVGVLSSFKIYHFKKDSADGRLLIWTVSLNMIKEKSLTGFGPNGFQKNYLLYQSDYLKNHLDSPWADLADDSASPFNEFLKIVIEQGIIGLLFVLAILFLAFRNSSTMPIVQSLLAALMAFSCFSFPFEWFIFQVLVVFCLASIANVHSVRNVSLSRKKHAFMPLMACIIMIASITFFFYYPYYSDRKKWKQTTESFSLQSNQKTVELESLYPRLKNNARFMFEYGIMLYFSHNYRKAIAVWKESIQLFPSAQAFVHLGECYEQTGEYDKALQAWERASYIKPSLFTPHYKSAKLYLKMQDYERTKEKACYILNKKEKIQTGKIYRMKQEMQEITDFINNNY